MRSMPEERPLTLMKLLLMAVSTVKQPPMHSSWKKGMASHHSLLKSIRKSAGATITPPMSSGKVRNEVKRIDLR